jgi:general secretion pathway protein C
MFARLSAFVIWSLVAATAVFWALRFTARPLPAPAYAVAVGKSVPIRGDLTRLFGAAPVVAVAVEAAPEASSRFKLVGVMAPRAGEARASAGNGLALIAVDGKPARAFAVGSHLDSDLVLQSVSHRSASLGPARGQRSVLLELPVLPAPATGVLPGPGGPAAMVQPSPPMAATMRGQPVPSAMAPVQSPAMSPPPMGIQPAPVPAGVAVPAAPVPTTPPNDNFRSQ